MVIVHEPAGDRAVETRQPAPPSEGVLRFTNGPSLAFVALFREPPPSAFFPAGQLTVAELKFWWTAERGRQPQRHLGRRSAQQPGDEAARVAAVGRAGRPVEARIDHDLGRHRLVA
ncbi:MAG: hypothetical protein WD067_11000 [Gaiellaceae bacterium]